MRGGRAPSIADSRWAHWPRGVLAVGPAGLLALAALVVVAARAGVPQDVTLPDWWGNWPHRQPGALHGWVAAGIVLVGALCATWVVLARELLRPRPAVADPARAEPDRRRPGVPLLAGIAGVWSLPLLLTGPLGSLDVQSYAAIGRLATLGYDPYVITPGWLGGGYGAAVDPMWRWTPTPYGPLQVRLLRELVHISGEHVGVAVLLIRAVAVLGAVGAVALAVRVATPADRVAVFVLVGLNPVLLLHVVSGAHLDVLVGGLAVLVVALTRAGRPALAMALAVLATFLKLPGAVLVAFVLLDLVRAGRETGRPGTVLRTVGAGLGAVGLVLVLCPDPFGWTAALGVPGISRNGTAPSTWTSYLVAVLTGHTSGAGLTLAFAVGRGLTALVGAVAACLLLWHATSGSRATAFRGVGWALVVLALTAPALYPWYLCWGLFAAALGSGIRGRVVLMGLSCALCLAACASDGTGVLITWSVVLFAVVGWCAWVGWDLVTGRSRGAGRPAVPSARSRAAAEMRAS
ncbi:MAG: polyprenol phosphomannose-dependent alpha 1,6 mannosyltransferase MptB [Blastococcus sp.]